MILIERYKSCRKLLMRCRFLSMKKKLKSLDLICVLVMKKRKIKIFSINSNSYQESGKRAIPHNVVVYHHTIEIIVISWFVTSWILPISNSLIFQLDQSMSKQTNYQICRVNLNGMKICWNLRAKLTKNSLIDCRHLNMTCLLPNKILMKLKRLFRKRMNRSQLLSNSWKGSIKKILNSKEISQVVTLALNISRKWKQWNSMFMILPKRKTCCRHKY